MENREFKIRDLRKKDQYKVDDEYLNGYARLCGVYATCVYNSLARHTEFYTQECFPSIKLIAEQHNLSKPVVISALGVLENANIIKKIKEKDEKGRQKKNVYVLLDKSEWKNKLDIIPIKNKRGINNERDNLGKFQVRVNNTDTDNPSKQYGQSRVNDTDKSRVNDMDCKGITEDKDNTVEGLAVQAPQEEIKENPTIEQPIQATPLPVKQGSPQVIKLFECINPDYKDWFGNPTQRASAEKLLLRAPFDKLEELITGIMPILNSTPYNPKDCKAFSPFELNRNWAKIMAKIKEKSIEAIQEKGRGIKVSGL